MPQAIYQQLGTIRDKLRARGESWQEALDNAALGGPPGADYVARGLAQCVEAIGVAAVQAFFDSEPRRNQPPFPPFGGDEIPPQGLLREQLGQLDLGEGGPGVADTAAAGSVADGKGRVGKRAPR